MRNSINVHVNGKTYIQRITPTLVGPLVFASFVIAIGYLGTESPWTLLAGAALFGLYLLERSTWARYYITDICELPNDKLKITYMDKNTVKEYTGDKKSFKLQRSSVWYKMKADQEQYLMFKDEQKGFSLKQYALGDWEDAMINKLMEEWEPEAEVNETRLAAAS